LLPAGSAREHVEAWTQQLLDRYGILFREMLDLEAGAPPWRELRDGLRRLEYAGQVRRGLFVAGVSGEQYARREAVELLRAMRGRDAREVWTAVSVVDPCAVWGVVAPGPRIARVPGNLMILRGGRPILALEGTRVHTYSEVSRDELAHAVAVLVRERQERKLVVQAWNDGPVVASQGWALLADAGFHTDGERLVYDGLPGPKAVTAER
jgi:ATP-dependent Lhr-like helicase